MNDLLIKLNYSEQLCQIQDININNNKKNCLSQIAQNNFYLKAAQFDKLPPTICVWLNVCFKKL